MVRPGHKWPGSDSQLSSALTGEEGRLPVSMCAGEGSEYQVLMLSWSSHSAKILCGSRTLNERD